MCHARRRLHRAMLVAQAALVWDDGKIDRERFIQYGELVPPKKLRKYNPHRIEALVNGVAHRG